MKSRQEAIMTLQYLAAHKQPVGTHEIADFLQCSIRTAQRILKLLAELGVAESDKCNPKGYRFTSLELKDNKKP